MSRLAWRGTGERYRHEHGDQPPATWPLGAVPAARGGLDPADPWLRIDGHGVSGLPAAGHPGHSRTAAPVK